MIPKEIVLERLLNNARKEYHRENFEDIRVFEATDMKGDTHFKPECTRYYGTIEELMNNEKREFLFVNYRLLDETSYNISVNLNSEVLEKFEGQRLVFLVYFEDKK